MLNASNIGRPNSRLEDPEHQMEGVEPQAEVAHNANQLMNSCFQDNRNNTEAMDERCNLGESTLQSTGVHISHSNMIDNDMVLTDFASAHPSAHLSREETNEIQRQNINVNHEYGESIMSYMRQLE